MIFHNISLYMLLLLLATLIFFACEKEHGELVFDNPNEPNNSKNLIINGGFEDGVPDPWYPYAPNEAVIDTEVINKEAIEGKRCLHVTVSKIGKNFWEVALIQYPSCIFKKGKVYTLSAYLKSSSNSQISYILQLGQEPWTSYCESKFIMTDTWHQYYITTPPMPEDVQSMEVVFAFGYDIGEFWIDDVRFYEGQYTIK